MKTLSKTRLTFETGAATHVGCVRTINEDSFLTRPELGLWAVADGVGGYEGGDVASRTVVEDLASIGPAVSHEDQVARFHARIARSNRTIQTLSEARGGAMMGTTVVAALAFDHRLSIVWAGDSRAYRIRDREIRQLSHDHSEVQELIDQKVIDAEQAKTWPRRNVITRAVGIFEDTNLQTIRDDLQAGDSILLCSDGLTGHLSDAILLHHVLAHRPQEACDTLIAATLERGAADNVTIVVIRCHQAEPTRFIPGHSVAAFRDGP